MRRFPIIGLCALMLALWPAGVGAAAVPCGHVDTSHGRHRDTATPAHPLVVATPCAPVEVAPQAAPARPKTPLRPPVRCSRADGTIRIVRYREDLPPPGWCVDVDPESCPGNSGDTTDYSCYEPEFRPPSAR
jgi:hypothetical protein